VAAERPRDKFNEPVDLGEISKQFVLSRTFSTMKARALFQRSAASPLRVSSTLYLCVRRCAGKNDIDPDDTGAQLRPDGVEMRCRPGTRHVARRRAATEAGRNARFQLWIALPPALD